VIRIICSDLEIGGHSIKVPLEGIEDKLRSFNLAVAPISDEVKVESLAQVFIRARDDQQRSWDEAVECRKAERRKQDSVRNLIYRVRSVTQALERSEDEGFKYSEELADEIELLHTALKRRSRGGG